jgi:hypothetical protein
MQHVQTIIPSSAVRSKRMHLAGHAVNSFTERSDATASPSATFGIPLTAARQSSHTLANLSDTASLGNASSPLPDGRFVLTEPHAHPSAGSVSSALTSTNAEVCEHVPGCVFLCILLYAYACTPEGFRCWNFGSQFHAPVTSGVGECTYAFVASVC